MDDWQEDRDRRQAYLEKERLGMMNAEIREDRKGSDVTVGGLGVLDRSGSGKYP